MKFSVLLSVVQQDQTIGLWNQWWNLRSGGWKIKTHPAGAGLRQYIFLNAASSAVLFLRRFQNFWLLFSPTFKVSLIRVQPSAWSFILGQRDLEGLLRKTSGNYLSLPKILSGLQKGRKLSVIWFQWGLFRRWLDQGKPSKYIIRYKPGFNRMYKFVKPMSPSVKFSGWAIWRKVLTHAILHLRHQPYQRRNDI